MLDASAIWGTKYFSNLHFVCRRKYVYVCLDKKFEIGKNGIADVKERESREYEWGW